MASTDENPGLLARFYTHAESDLGLTLLPAAPVPRPDRVGLLCGAREREVRDGRVGISAGTQPVVRDAGTGSDEF